MQNPRNFTLSAPPKAKKTVKDRDKRKSVTGPTQIESNFGDKPSPTKEYKEYAGIGADSIIIYAEQSTCERPSDDVCSLLAEDINYKLRYIIHECLIKARLSGREAITSGDVDECFQNLSIDKVYGASSNPNWVPFADLTTDQNLLYLDDTKINLIQVAEEDLQQDQQAEIILEKSWNGDEPVSEEESTIVTEYFKTVCQSVISNDKEIRYLALEDISENPLIGPITEWFYHFAYFLLTKDITYDCLTLRALHLVEILENSPISNENVSEKQLKLLVRLLLQRLLMSKTTREVLRSMSYVLSILCLCEPLKQMAIMKIQQKISVICEEMPLSVLTIIYYLGVEAVSQIFLPNMNYFLTKIIQENNPEIKDITLSIYDLICKSNMGTSFVHESFHTAFGILIVPYWRPKNITASETHREIDFVNMKKRLIKTRRKVSCKTNKDRYKMTRDDFFDLPSEPMDVGEGTSPNVILGNKEILNKISFKIRSNKLQTKLNRHEVEISDRILKCKETKVTVGKISLLLKVLESNETRCIPMCYEHSLLNYNL